MTVKYRPEDDLHLQQLRDSHESHLRRAADAKYRRHEMHCVPKSYRPCTFRDVSLLIAWYVAGTVVGGLITYGLIRFGGF